MLDKASIMYMHEHTNEWKDQEAPNIQKAVKMHEAPAALNIHEALIRPPTVTSFLVLCTRHTGYTVVRRLTGGSLCLSVNNQCGNQPKEASAAC